MHYLDRTPFWKTARDVIAIMFLIGIAVLIALSPFAFVWSVQQPTPEQTIIVSPEKRSITTTPGFYPFLVESHYSDHCGAITDPIENTYPCWRTELYDHYSEYKTEQESYTAIVDTVKRLSK